MRIKACWGGIARIIKRTVWHAEGVQGPKDQYKLAVVVCTVLGMCQEIYSPDKSSVSFPSSNSYVHPVP